MHRPNRSGWTGQGRPQSGALFRYFSVSPPGGPLETQRQVHDGSCVLKRPKSIDLHGGGQNQLQLRFQSRAVRKSEGAQRQARCKSWMEQMIDIVWSFRSGDMSSTSRTEVFGSGRGHRGLSERGKHARLILSSLATGMDVRGAEIMCDELEDPVLDMQG